MGKWVLGLIVFIALAMGGSLIWLHSHRDEFREVVLTALMNDFQGEKDKLLAEMPADLKLNSSESWSLDFKGDELWVTAPTLERKQGTSPLEIADFDRTRTLIVEAMKNWLSKRPGDNRRFPIRLKFRNEPTATEASTH